MQFLKESYGSLGKPLDPPPFIPEISCRFAAGTKTPVEPWLVVGSWEQSLQSEIECPTQGHIQRYTDYIPKAGIVCWGLVLETTLYDDAVADGVNPMIPSCLHSNFIPATNHQPMRIYGVISWRARTVGVPSSDLKPGEWKLQGQGVLPLTNWR